MKHGIDFVDILDLTHIEELVDEVSDAEHLNFLVRVASLISSSVELFTNYIEKEFKDISIFPYASKIEGLDELLLLDVAITLSVNRCQCLLEG